MGTGNSKHTSIVKPSDNEVSFHIMRHGIDKKNNKNGCILAENKIETVRHITHSNEPDLVHFLNENKLINNIELLKDIEGLRNTKYSVLDEISQNLIDSYKKNMDKNNSKHCVFLKLLETCDSHSILILLLTIYPEFNTYQSHIKSIQSSNTEYIEAQSFKSMTSQQSLLSQTFESIGQTDIDRFYVTGSCFVTLLNAVEDLPVCVSISTANQERPGFPLVYVNKCFEKTTLYPRNMIIGKNCRFLQADKAEPESIARITEALKYAKPIRVSITNVKKDGTLFRNLLAMKPMFDENGVYRYVIGVQFDVSLDDSTPAKLKLADELLKMLPDTIESNQCEL